MTSIIDLFSGVGGLSLGFRQNGFEVVVANEFDKHIANSYVKNHPETLMINDDITSLDISKVFAPYKGKVSGIVGGPPCQGYSQKGRRMTINDPRNFLFRKFIETVETVQPEFFVMENVPNLLTAHGGYFAAEIRALFEKIGYKITTQVADASAHGVPQNRRRAIILGSFRREIVLEDSPPVNKNSIWDAISDLNFLESGEGSPVAKYRLAAQTELQSELRNGSTILKNHVATRHTPLAIERMSMVREGKGRSSLPAEHHTKSIFSGTWGRMDRSVQAVTITTRFDTPSSGCFTHPVRNRAITVREAARLQTFPDTFSFTGPKSSQMKQVGNAVPPKLASDIAMTIVKNGG